MAQVVPSPHQTEFGLTVDGAVLLSGQENPRVLYLYDPTLREWPEGEALPRLALLPAI